MPSTVAEKTSVPQVGPVLPEKPAGTGHSSTESVCDWLLRALPKCPTAVDALQITMQRMVSRLNAPYCRISIESPTGAFDDERGAVDPWGRLCKGQQLKSRLGQSPVGQRRS
ncbi:MAG: hypothetical protein O3C60_17400 [Planctomycetota bacterium]|nr:hypothetical protein [Planctomycetota bacterium]